MKSISSEVLSSLTITASLAWRRLRPADDPERFGSEVAELVRGRAVLGFRGPPLAPWWPLVGGADLGGLSLKVAGGPVDLIKSAKSPMESRSTLASLG